MTLDASASSDPEAQPLTYEWDLDNDGNFGEPGEPTGATPLVSWATLQSYGIDDDGVCTIGLRVTDDVAQSDMTTTTLTVNNVAPTLTTTGGATVNEGDLYTLNLSAVDPGNDTVTGWTINWGDGSIETIAGNPPSVTHTYNAAVGSPSTSWLPPPMRMARSCKTNYWCQVIPAETASFVSKRPRETFWRNSLQATAWMTRSRRSSDRMGISTSVARNPTIFYVTTR